MSDTIRIKEQLDVLDVVGEYVKLSPAGVNHKGLCPFHSEKSPSFMVNRERQSWHCFGCAKGGDIFSFIQEIEGMSFVEALQLLANKAGIELSRQTFDKTKSDQKNRIKDINALAARFFHHILMNTSAAEGARAYLTDRGLSEETMVKWKIGFVPDQWDALTKYMTQKGHGIDDLVAAGLTIKRDGASSGSNRGFYDRFRGRIMFPIWNEHGAVVGFTGRVLVETEKSGGKYVNTPQTPIFDKSRVVFGLDKAKQAIRKAGQIVMTEGQMDVIAAHQAGMENVVASSGTALTEQQIKLLKRYASKMAMAFDADEAGQKAAKRGIDIAIAAGMDVRVIQIPEDAGKDPDDCIREDKDAWFAAVENAVGIMNWYFDKACKGKDLSDPRQKQAVANELLPEIARIPQAVEQDHWLQELGTRLHTEVSILREDMKRLLQTEKSLKRGNITAPVQRQVAAPTSRFSLLVERLLTLLCRYPAHIPEAMQVLTSIDISGPSLHPLYELLKKRYTAGNAISIDDLRDACESSDNENIVDVLLMKSELVFSGFTDIDAKSELDSLLIQIRKEWIKQRGEQLQRQIADAEVRGDVQQLEELLRTYQALQHNG